MSEGFEEAGLQHKFTETISNSYFSKFKTQEEIIQAYSQKGYSKIELHNATDNEGNLLAYTFNVFCYKTDNNSKQPESSGFVRYDQFLKDKE
ncbi:MAG: hypothetical protein HQK84_07075 [Nitrospinae bacterium]|nr:hypothetical protein [Nitrospinota bacterium]